MMSPGPSWDWEEGSDAGGKDGLRWAKRRSIRMAHALTTVTSYTEAADAR